MVRDDRYVVSIVLLESLSTGAIRVDHVRTDDNLVDPLTKGLAREKVHKTSKGMGLLPLE